MGRGDHLGEFEQLVLLALLSLEGDQSYGMNVRRVLAEIAGRDVSVPTVYSALDRLEAKGLVRSHLGEATPERGGRAKRFFRVRRAGVAALREARGRLDRMWEAAGMAPRQP
ncbi:MAG TPA: helix-turn-helix transcriptional regulator [Longimicrobiales bacterium]|jgi:DNA-binding PadR family transcriptional regulator|nr:helix-turn-helix transcriptional regulator [Longimicrobiales bacterium]